MQSSRQTREHQRKAILNRIAEIDQKFKVAEPWLHPSLAKLAREREELVALSNEKFGTNLRHEWR
jgi:hypothetical protein